MVAIPVGLALLIVSLPLLLIGNLLLLVRGYNLRPQHSLFSGKWEKTTRDRFAKMRTMEQEVKKWDETVTDLTCVTGFMGLMLVAVGIGIVGFVLQSSQSTRFWAPIFVADAVVLLVPHWITGTRRGWRPIALRQQIDALEIALAAVDTFQVAAVSNSAHVRNGRQRRPPGAHQRTGLYSFS